MNKGKQKVSRVAKMQNKATARATRAQKRVLGARDKAQDGASKVVGQKKGSLELAFELLSLVLAILGSTLLFVPDKVALLAFGPGVFKPSDGKVPEAASKAYTWISSPDYPLPLAYEVDLRIIGSAILGASLVSYLLKRAAAEGTLNQRLYKRLVMALFAWAALSAGISLVYRDLWYYRPLMVWLVLLVDTAILTGALVLAENPVSTLQETVAEAKDVRTGRGKLFLTLSVFIFAEGLGILAHPTLAQRGLSGPSVDMRDPVIGLLFSLVAASAHIIVPAAAFNLKCLSDQGNLSNLTSFLNNTVLFVVAGTHVINLTHSALAGNVGPVAPVLLTAWIVAFITSLSLFPYTMEGQQW